jgi:hypothetical protein
MRTRRAGCAPDRLHANVEAVSKLTPPEAASVPGSWARSLIGGLLKSLPSAVSTIGEYQSASEAHPGSSIFQTANDVKDIRQQKAQQQQKALDEHDRQRATIRAALAKITMRLKGMASGEACNIVTRTRLRFLRSFGEQRHVNNARTGVDKRKVGQNREIRDSGRRCRWNYG